MSLKRHNRPMSSLIDVRILWRLEEDKLFWLHTNPRGNESCPWNIGSCDINNTYDDWIQLSCRLTQHPDRITLIGASQIELESRLKLWVLQEFRERYSLREQSQVKYKVKINRVDNIGDLWRALLNFDTASLIHTQRGRAWVIEACYPDQNNDL